MINPHFQPAALVSSLRGIGLPNTGFDEHGAKFYPQLFFESCNTIPSKADIGLQRNICRYGLQDFSKCIGGLRAGRAVVVVDHNVRG